MSTTIHKVQRKWVIGLPDRIGPVEELVMLIPRVFPDDDDYYFVRYNQQAVPAYRVFDTSQEATLGAIGFNKQKIRDLNMENTRLEAYLDALIKAEQESPA